MSWSLGWLMLSVGRQFSSASAEICGVDLVRFFYGMSGVFVSCIGMVMITAKQPGSPEHGFNSGREISGQERFGQVVIGSLFEADYPIHPIGARGEHHHG